MAVNGKISETTFEETAQGTVIKASHMEQLRTAITALEGYAANVDNCGNCTFCQTTTCQSCQSQTCQSQSCQRCQRNCNCNC